MDKMSTEKCILLNEWFHKHVTIRDKDFADYYWIAIALFINDANKLELFDESKVNSLIKWDEYIGGKKQ